MSFLEDNLDLFLTELKEKDETLLSKLKRKKIKKERLIKFNCDCALIVADVACNSKIISSEVAFVIKKSLTDHFKYHVSILGLGDDIMQAWETMKSIKITKCNRFLGREERVILDRLEIEVAALEIVINCIQSIDIEEPWNDLIFRDVIKFNKESKEKALTLLKDLIDE